MALLLEKTNQCRTHLRALHLFGRNPAKVDTAIDGADASQVHASIRWDGGAWLLHDHSRNGTYVDAKLLRAGDHHQLANGETLRFASGARQCWSVLDLAPPCPLLLPFDPALPAISLNGLHFLPDAHLPQAALYRDAQGVWQYEDADGSRALRDGDTLRIGRQGWRYADGVAPDATAAVAESAAGEAAPIRFNFAVSQNEEHVELSISTGRGLVDLGERSHHYGLLTLARQRLRDARRGFDRYSQGWLGTDELAQMLHLDPKHLNMQLHRARQQISDAVTARPATVNIIERRRGELRFGSVLFQIRRGALLEGSFDPAEN
jgi:hypothetical protein